MKTKNISLVMEEEMKEKIRIASFKLNITKSEFIRIAIEEKLERCK